MFSRDTAAAEDDEKKDVFAPVADLMVGVIFIFIILMIVLVLNLRPEDTVAKSEYEQKVTQVRTLEAEVADLKASLAKEREMRAAAEAKAVVLAEANARLVDFVRFVRDTNVMRLMSQLATASQERSRLLEEIRSKLADATKIDVTVNPAAGTLLLPAKRLFDIGKAEPTADGRKTIVHLGTVLTDVLPCYSDKAPQKGAHCRARGNASQLNAVYIEGHTDVTPFSAPGTRFTDNWDLSAGRAIEAYKIVSAQSDSLRALRNADGDPLLGVSGYADTRPAVRDAPDRHVPEIADKDRRIEVRVIMTTNEELVESVLTQLNERLRKVDDLVGH